GDAQADRPRLAQEGIGDQGRARHAVPGDDGDLAVHPCAAVVRAVGGADGAYRFVVFLLVMAMHESASSSKVQSFLSACGRAAHFLCLCKESEQRNTPRTPRPTGIPALRVRESAPGFFERTSMCARKTGARRARQSLCDLSSTASPCRTGPQESS